jgi:outer membrane phospholipase A
MFWAQSLFLLRIKKMRNWKLEVEIWDRTEDRQRNKNEPQFSRYEGREAIGSTMGD